LNEKTEVCPGAVKEEAAPPPGPSAQEKLLMDIRDLLKGQNR